LIVPDPGSFRDPAGRVYIADDRVYRSITALGVDHYSFARDSGVLSELVAEEIVPAYEELPPDELRSIDPKAVCVLSQQKLGFISYPYEWPFALLKRAALFHLDLHLRLLDRGATLSDGSAYNVQFRGTRPVFIDVLSIRRYRPGEFWAGHRQFCEQFLHPLLLQSVAGVGFHAWYRGALEGIPGDQLVKTLPLGRKLAWRMLTQVVAPVIFQRKASGAVAATLGTAAAGIFPFGAFIKLLQRLRSWIAELGVPRTATAWSDYSRTCSYSAEEESTKRRLVGEFVAMRKPPFLLDLGCNTGEYACIALDAGAGAVVGVDSDLGALDLAVTRGDEGRNLLPLLIDLANPSPGQGWNGAERRDFASRARADAVLALALHHHLTIGRNVPLDSVVDWIVSRAPAGLIEFVPKSDPMVRRMLSLREDVFGDLSANEFADVLRARARIAREEPLSTGGRRLFWFER
jgi:ribosomal protein L11 methylase PrmA